MKILKYTISLALIFTLFISCNDDSTSSSSNAPSVTEPDAQKVLTGESVDLTFSVTADAGYESASVTANNGDATISSEPNSGDTSGDIVINYTGNQAGAGSVEVTVTDTEGMSNNATAVVSVKDEQTEVTVTDNITSDTTWEDDKTYILSGRIAVEGGATLTIEGGAIIKGEAGSGTNATALLVARDATLNANGTANAPIIFTSVADEITHDMVNNGNFSSPNLDSSQRGLWGGVLVLGNAPISASSSPASIEGIPSTDQNGLYGGNDAGDSSGSLTYVTIRHGGTNIGQGNEINGLSLGGVGTGTTIENIEVVANQDDGIEWFGGTVDVTNVLVWNNGDDALDTDQDWQGTVDNVVTLSPSGSTLELDGPEGSNPSGNAHTIQNVSAFVENNGSEMIDVDANTNVNVSNILFFGLATTSGGSADNTISSDYSNYASNTNGFAITSIEAVIPSGLTKSDYFPSGLQSEVTEVADVSSASIGADVSVFSWTWASQSDALSDIGLE
ncbi:hypothetical protein LX73_0885 [Fodinibius salinus]|uniref:Uncharacterized protein n=1 Tax=Fodinibius salinus TaxID=860790 RepID=A0A5D3YN66_9BACT|nr:hypothetical protein [Fodinibius salinus]TYP95576.1 hypothetical protein LX73_0885 [Fodinibius salinus]